MRFAWIIFAALLGVFTAANPPASGGSAAADGVTAETEAASYRGTVLTIAPEQLTLWTHGRSTQFAVDGNTLVLINGMGGHWRDIRPGYRAEITAVRSDDTLMAQFIDAYVPR